MTDLGSADPVSTELLNDAVQLAREAGRLTLNWFGNHDLTVNRKGDGSPVTDADKAAESLLRDHLSDRFPDDAIIGEEHTDTEGTSGRTWIIDPIDGTRSFVRGVPLYTTLLAMFDEHGPALGVVAVPGLEETVWAGRGRGCFHNGKRCRVSSRADLSRSYLCTSGLEWWPDGALSRVSRSGARMRTWGDGYGYVLVATGRVEAMVDPGLNLWDIAPMLVVIPEAGGRITTWDGNAWGDNSRNGGFRDDSIADTGNDWLATNGAVHDQLLSRIRPG